MNKNLTWKLALIIAILLFFLYGIFGIPSSWSGRGLLASLQQRIHLGLDLKGGTHLILQVQVNDAVKVEADNAIERLKSELRARKINYTEISQPDPANSPDKIVIKGVPPEVSSDLRSIVSDRLPEYNLASGAENTWTLSMKPQTLAELKQRAVTQAIETIRNRIDQLGVSEPVIQEHGLGQYQILVQLPGVDDPARVKDIMQSTAMLEIKQSLGGPYPSEQAALQDKGGILPPDAILLPGSNMAAGREEGQAWYLVSRVSAVSGKDLRDAQPSRDQNGQPSVSFTLSGEGGQRFYNFTSAHTGDSLAVVLDNKVQEVANIREPIRDRGEISGGRMNEQQSKDLSMILNLIILLGFMGYFGAVLTLPGIAGVILTVGMGVDSNVLIFERIREELRNGKTPPSAVEQGFGHAWITIVDTHVTTIVSAIILFLFGTGPVRGFAVTLSFGLFANLFTAVFVSRVIFDWVLSRKRVGEALSI